MFNPRSNTLIKNKKTLKLSTLNARGIHANQTEIEHWIVENSPDALLVQETLSEKKLEIAGYNVIAQKQPHERGQAVYIKIDLQYDTPDISQYKTDGMELMCVEIKLKNKQRITLFNTYCKDKKLNIETMDKMLKSDDHCLSLGDNNAKMDIPLHDDTNENGRKLQTAFENDILTPILPDGYTRYDPADRKPSCIDFMITPAQTKIVATEVEIGEDVGSDHLPVTYTISIPEIVKGPIKTSVPNFGKANHEKFQNIVDQKTPTFERVADTKQSIDMAIDNLENLILEADISAIPRKTIADPSQPPLPPYIVEYIEEKRHLKKIKKRLDLDKETKKQITKKINYLKSEIERETTTFKRESIDRKWTETENKSPYGFYKLAKRLANENTKTKTTYPITDDNNKPIKDNEEKAETFRTLYEDIYSSPEPDPEHLKLHQDANTYTDNLFSDYEHVQYRDGESDISTTVTPEDVLHHTKHTKQTAPGADKIYYTHIKMLPQSGLSYLSEIYSACLRTTYFPDKWKFGTVILTHKPGKDARSVKSYRPITLLSVLGKTLERIINDRLKKHIEDNKLLPDSQAGFRSGMSTQDKLLQLVQDISKSFQSGNITLAAYHDIEKAFDKMWIAGFLYKLHTVCKLKRNTIALIASFIRNRSVQFKIEDIMSRPLTPKAGTPQGAILSPTLFNLWLSDIPQPTKKSKLSQFADDIATWASANRIDNARENLQKYNDKLSKWCQKWKVLLNPNKTNVVCYSRKPPQSLACAYQYINGVRIEAVDEAKFLGVTIDNRLKFKTHRDEVVQKLKTKCARFISITGTPTHPRASEETGIKIMRSMILPVAGYAHTIAVMFPQSFFDELDTIYLQAARKALHLPRTITKEYVHSKVRLEPSRDVVFRNAKNYITNEKRSDAVKNFLLANPLTALRRRRTFETPLDKILLEMD